MDALKRKDYDRITVSELCAAAEINRSTFYLHYETSLAVFDELLAEVLSEMLSGAEDELTGTSLEELFRFGELSRSRAMQDPENALLLQKGFTYPRFMERYCEETAKIFVPHLHGAPELTDEQRFELVKAILYAVAMLNKSYAARTRAADLSDCNDLLNRYLVRPAMEQLM